ncbi:MAG: ribonuclease HI [Buchnera aphidicola (Nurudea yanoniella)]
MSQYIKVFSDGSCLGNPGPGGYSSIIKYKSHELIISSGFYQTTNNRMELMGVIIALEKLKKSYIIKVIIDSQYVKNGIVSWIKQWKLNNWKTSRNKKVKNIDLWMRLNYISKFHNITWKWIKSHSGHVENEKCNTLAQYSAKHPTFKDIGYIP